MSVRDAIATASKEALSAYLSPELCEQLTDEIVHRVSAELEGAINTFVGFDVARAARATPTAKKGPGRKGRRPGVGSGSEAERHSLNDSKESAEPTPEQMV